MSYFTQNLYLITDITGVLSVHMDCEQPPAVTHATVKISDDENDDLVSATYACKNGYKLQGEAELFCDLNTDEWQGDPPLCKSG